MCKHSADKYETCPECKKIYRDKIPKVPRQDAFEWMERMYLAECQAKGIKPLPMGYDNILRKKVRDDTEKSED